MDKRGVSSVLTELMMLAVSLAVLSAVAYFWLNVALPAEKVELAVKADSGRIIIYDMAGVMDCRKVRIVLQNQTSYQVVEVFRYNNSRFVGVINGWQGSYAPPNLNPGDCIILNATPGKYVITIANDRAVLAQCVIIVR